MKDKSENVVKVEKEEVVPVATPSVEKKSDEPLPDLFKDMDEEPKLEVTEPIDANVKDTLDLEKKEDVAP